MNAEQWAESQNWDWGDEYQVVAVKRIAATIAAAGIDTDEAVRRIGGEHVREAAELRQTSGELCPRCGWRMVLPGDGCIKCAYERSLGTPAGVAAPSDPERERRRWELYRDLVVREYTDTQDALRIADSALAAYYGEQHGS